MFDVDANRRSRKRSLLDTLHRVAWMAARPLFRLSPRPLWGWRRMLLRLFGAKVGVHAHIYPSVRIAVPWHLNIGAYSAVGDHAILYSLGRIRIGNRTTVSQGAHLCAGTHDYRDATLPLVLLPINIDDEAWVCADAFVGPGVTIGARAIVGARGVAMRDVPASHIVVGNPARFLRMRPMLENSPVKGQDEPSNPDLVAS